MLPYALIAQIAAKQQNYSRASRYRFEELSILRKFYGSESSRLLPVLNEAGWAAY